MRTSASVLAVDDDEKIRESIQYFLSTGGYKVMTVPGITQAQEVLSSQSVNVLILDLNLDGESGLSFLKSIRNGGNNAHLPVIIFSGAVTPAVEAELKESGATEVVDKADGILPLMEIIEKLSVAKEGA